jgi:hypothetical protein
MMRVFVTDHARVQYARRFYEDFRRAGRNVDVRLVALVRDGVRVRPTHKSKGTLLRNGKFLFAVHIKQRGMVLATVMRAANDD